MYLFCNVSSYQSFIYVSILQCIYFSVYQCIYSAILFSTRILSKVYRTVSHNFLEKIRGSRTYSLPAFFNVPKTLENILVCIYFAMNLSICIYTCLCIYYAMYITIYLYLSIFFPPAISR